MKRTVILSLLVVLCLMIVSGCASGSAEEGALSPEMDSAAAPNKDDHAAAAGTGLTKTGGALIGKDRARAIALKHAGLSGSRVGSVKVKLDYEDGRQVYEIEFSEGNSEYDYEIDALTGDILSYDHEIERSAAANGGTGAGAARSSGESGLIGKDRARAIALKHAGISGSRVGHVKVKLDYEDGRQVYEIEFSEGNSEYDYEIDALTGDILSYEYETESGAAVKDGPESAAIGKDRARAIALKHAGLSGSRVGHVKVKLDYEDGRQVYEIEFSAGNSEYDYEIDARTGTILSYEVESHKASR